AGQGAHAVRRGRHRGRVLHRIHHARAAARAPHPRRAHRATLNCSQLIHMSTAIHSRGNRTAWRGLARAWSEKPRDSSTDTPLETILRMITGENARLALEMRA